MNNSVRFFTILICGLLICNTFSVMGYDHVCIVHSMNDSIRCGDSCKYERVEFLGLDSKFLRFRYLERYDFKPNECSTDFFGAKFDKEATFYKDTLDNVTSFSFAHFTDKANFRSTNFKRNISFALTKFDSAVFFTNAKFDSTANFNNALFNSRVYFNFATFSSNVSLHYAKLPKYLNLSKVKIEKEIDFTTCDYDSGFICYINLLGAPINKIKLQYKYFQLDWTNIDDIDTKQCIYEQLLAQTEQLGYMMSYEKLDKEYKKFKYLSIKKSKFRNFLDKFWWDYGYDKTLIFENTFYLFLFFFIINYILIHNRLVNRVYVIEKFQNDNSGSLIKRFLFSNRFLYSLSYTATVFFGLKFDFNKVNFERNLKFSDLRFLNLIYLFSMYISGLVCLGYLVNFVLSK